MYGATIGKSSILGIDATTNQACAVGIPNTRALNTNYLYYYLISQRELFIEAGKGGAQPNISQGVIKGWPIPIAPLNEQKRIADKLDLLLAQVNVCRERLDRLAELIKGLRQTIFEFVLSENSVEDWQTVNLKSICTSITDGDHQAPPQTNAGIPFITISAINDGTLRLERATRFVHEQYFSALKPTRKPTVGDILFSVTGSIAIPALVDTSEPFTFQRHIAILKPDHSKVMSQFLLFALRTDKIRRQSEAVATGTAQVTIPLSGVNMLEIQLPPMSEQAYVVRRVETILAFADHLEARLRATYEAVDRMRPALLSKAFRGELVEQDPNDEPASVLLERIKNTPVEKKRVPRNPAEKRTKVVAKTLKEIAPTHLTDTLRAQGGRLTPEELLRLSELTVDDFYTQIKREMETIRDIRPDEQTHFLEATA